MGSGPQRTGRRMRARRSGYWKTDGAFGRTHRLLTFTRYAKNVENSSLPVINLALTRVPTSQVNDATAIVLQSSEITRFGQEPWIRGKRR